MRLTPAVLLLSGALALTGCGGDDAAPSASAVVPSAGASAAPTASPSAPTGTALSFPEYVLAANEVCAEGSRAVSRLERPTADSTPEQVSAFVNAGLAPSREVLSGLEALVPPPERADELEEQFTGPFGRQLTAARNLIQIGASGTPDAQREELLTSAATNARDQRVAYASRNGLDDCTT